jgi:hypothetical protein
MFVTEEVVTYPETRSDEDEDASTLTIDIRSNELVFKLNLDTCGISSKAAKKQISIATEKLLVELKQYRLDSAKFSAPLVGFFDQPQG